MMVSLVVVCISMIVTGACLGRDRYWHGVANFIVGALLAGVAVAPKLI